MLALQLHAGPPMKIQFKDIRLKTLQPTDDGVTALQGDWVPANMVWDGEAVSADVLAGIKLTVKGNEYFVETDTGTDRGTFKVREGAQLKAMDVTTDSGEELPAICEIGADSFKVCYAINGGPRPTDFKSEPGSGRVSAAYKRKK